MLRLLLTLSFVFGMSIFSGMGHLYAQSGGPPAIPGCRCLGEGCTCPKKGACDGSSITSSGDKLFCRGKSSKGTGTAPADTSPPAIPGCRCLGEGCTCPKKGACDGSSITSSGDKLFCRGKSSKGTGTAPADTSPPGIPGCRCLGEGCTCPKKDTCATMDDVIDKETRASIPAWMIVCSDVSGGGTGVATPAPSGEPSPDEWSDACSCDIAECVCPKDLACNGATSWDKDSVGSSIPKLVCGGVSGGGSCSCDIAECVCPKDLACDGATSWDKDSVGSSIPKLVCGGVSGGGTGATTPAPSGEPSLEWSSACRCGGGECMCLEPGVCGVERWKAEIKILKARIAKADPEGAELFALPLSGFRKALKEAEKQCK